MLNGDRCLRTVLAISVLLIFAINVRPASSRGFPGPAHSINQTTVDRRENASIVETSDLQAKGNESQRRTPIPLCCPPESRKKSKTCIKTNDTFHFPPLYDSYSFELLNDSPTIEAFDWTVRDPCNGRDEYRLQPEEIPEDAFMLLDNGSIYHPNMSLTTDPDSYCFGILDKDTYDVVLCFSAEDSPKSPVQVIFAGMIISALFLLATFVVYTVLPELKNMHGRTLRGYVGSLLVAYVTLVTMEISPQQQISNNMCIAFGSPLSRSSSILINSTLLLWKVAKRDGRFQPLDILLNNFERHDFHISPLPKYLWRRNIDTACEICTRRVTSLCLFQPSSSTSRSSRASSG